MALWAAWTWFVGMMIFGLGMHWQGLLAVPRRTQISNLPAALADAYANAAMPAAITALPGVVLTFAIVFYFWVLFGTLFSKRTLAEKDVPEIPWSSARNLESVGLMRFMDQLSIWTWLAILLVAVAYLPTLISMMVNQVPIPGLRLW